MPTSSRCLSPPHHSSGEIQAEATVVCLFRYARPVRRESSTCHLCREYSAPTPNQTSLHFFEAPTKPALISNLTGRVWHRALLTYLRTHARTCLPIPRRTNFSAPVRCAPHPTATTYGHDPLLTNHHRQCRAMLRRTIVRHKTDRAHQLVFPTDALR